MAWNTIYAVGDDPYSATLFGRYAAAGKERYAAYNAQTPAFYDYLFASIRPCQIASPASTTHKDGSALVGAEIAICDNGIYYQYNSVSTSWTVYGSGRSATATTYTSKSGVYNSYAAKDYASNALEMLTAMYGVGGGWWGKPRHRHAGVDQLDQIPNANFNDYLMSDATTVFAEAGYAAKSTPSRIYPQTLTDPNQTTYGDGSACADGDIALETVITGLYYVFDGTPALGANKWTVYGSGRSATATTGNVGSGSFVFTGCHATTDLWNESRDWANVVTEFYRDVTANTGTNNLISGGSGGAVEGLAASKAAAEAAYAAYTPSSDAEEPIKLSTIVYSATAPDRYACDLRCIWETYRVDSIATFCNSIMRAYISVNAPETFDTVKEFDASATYRDGGANLLIQDKWNRFDNPIAASGSPRTTAVCGNTTRPVWSPNTPVTVGNSVARGWHTLARGVTLDWYVTGGFAYTAST